MRHLCGQDDWIQEFPSWRTLGMNQDKGQSESETNEASACLIDAKYNTE